MRGPKPTQPCGTAAAARRHRRNGEPLDAACRDAERRDQSERKGYDSLAHSPDHREVRNGLPPFRPYVYGASRRAS